MCQNWVSDYESILRLYDRAEKAQKQILCQTPGKRSVVCLSYGDAGESKSFANYSSACGAMNPACYKSKRVKPTVILIAGVHGQETEGIAALYNLITLMETGFLPDGTEKNELLALAKRLRLVIVPIANPDGRARVEPDAIVGLTGKELRYWGQGTWQDGSLCGWPECKAVHPMRAYGFLGGYFNDDGINIMHDNFFSPMAKETAALLKLADTEKPDCIYQLHGGSNSMNALLQPHYVPKEINQAIFEIAGIANEHGEKEGLPFSILPIPDVPSGKNPPSFNLVSALHHVCGAVSACFESNEGLIDEGGPCWNREQILRSHEILFEETFRYFLNKSLL